MKFAFRHYTTEFHLAQIPRVSQHLHIYPRHSVTLKPESRDRDMVT